MTTSRSVTSAVLAAALAFAGAAWAQDKPDPAKPDPKGEAAGEPSDDDGGLAPGGREVTDDMVKVCPELKGAFGRRKDQLVAIYFDLDWRKAQTDEAKKLVKDLFDLKNAQDVALLEGLLTDRGAYRAQKGVRAVVAAAGPQGLAWVLQEFESIKPEGKGRLLDSLAAVRLREAWRFLETRLGDKTPVPDWRAAQEAPPGYSDLRTCDYAFRTIAAMLLDEEAVKMPPEARSGQVSSMMAIEQRDERIAALKGALAADKAYAALLAKEPRMLDGLDEADKKAAQGRLEKLGVKAE